MVDDRAAAHVADVRAGLTAGQSQCHRSGSTTRRAPALRRAHSVAGVLPDPPRAL